MLLFASDDESPFETAARNEQARIVARAIAGLSEKQRHILVLIYVKEMSFADAGRSMRISKVAVWKAHSRILDTLAAKLTEMGMTRL